MPTSLPDWMVAVNPLGFIDSLTIGTVSELLNDEG